MSKGRQQGPQQTTGLSALDQVAALVFAHLVAATPSANPATMARFAVQAREAARIFLEHG